LQLPAEFESIDSSPGAKRNPKAVFFSPGFGWPRPFLLVDDYHHSVFVDFFGCHWSTSSELM
jgi:hypothetical protein